MINCRKRGFSLAEILITLGVIGVTVAIVLPSLIIRYRHMALNNKMKKSYSILAQSMQRAVPDGDYGANINFHGEGETRLQTFFDDYIKPYIKVINVCGYNNDGCWTQKKDRSGNPIGQSDGINDSFSFVLSDGSTMALNIFNKSQSNFISETFGIDTSSLGSLDAFPVIYVDTNANRNPNVLGKDVHVFVLTDRGYVPAGRKVTDDEIWPECTSVGYYCFEGILRNNWRISEHDAW